MRVTLYHNPKAGKDEHEGSDLVEQLTRKGHEVSLHSPSEKLTELDRSKTNLVVAAGGDGTVAKVARQLVGQTLHLASSRSAGPIIWHAPLASKVILII